MYKDIRAKVLNRFLYESQKKSFKRRVESGMEFDSREIEQNVLLKTKKTKIPSTLSHDNLILNSHRWHSPEEEDKILGILDR